MLNFNRFAIILLLLFTFLACTKSGEFYDKAKHTKEDFSVTNTVLGVAGAALAVGAIAAGAKSGGGGSVTDYDWDWDYQPSNNQWVCRGIQTGQYSELSNCAYDVKDDDRWPG